MIKRADISRWWRPRRILDRTPPTLREQRDNLELINAEVTDRLARQAAAGSQIDTKAALVAGAALAATQFLAVRAEPVGVLVVLAYSTFLLAFVAAVLTYAVRAYDEAPEPRPLVRNYVGSPVEWTLAHLVNRRVDAFDANHARYRSKARRWWVSAVLLVVGIACSTAALLQNEPMTADPRPERTPADAVPDIDSPMATGDGFFGEYDDARLTGTESKGDDQPRETRDLAPRETR